MKRRKAKIVFIKLRDEKDDIGIVCLEVSGLFHTGKGFNRGENLR